MKKTLKKLWNEYISDECSKINTDEEQMLMRKTVELHEKVKTLLNKEQEDAVEKYTDALCDVESLFVKKAFFKGYEFAVSFLLENGVSGK